MQEEGSEELMAGGIDWFRWHHGSVNDPKFRLVARRACVRVGDVIALWALLLEHAGRSGGDVLSFDAKKAEEILDIPVESTARILVELAARGFIEGGRVDDARRYFPTNSLRPSGGVWARIRAMVFARDDYTCRYCGARGGRLECDHVKPVAAGGGHSEGNLVTACFTCNRKKAARDVQEFMRDR